METSDRTTKSTEERLNDAILQVQSAAISKQMFHLSHVFTGDPNGYLAVNATFVVCNDKLAPELHARLDATVDEFFKDHNIVPKNFTNPDKHADEEHNSENNNVVPIYGIYKEEDGYAQMRLTRDVSQKVDYIAKLTGLDRDSAMQMVISRFLEKMNPRN